MLTTKDFIREVEKLGFEVGQGINIILIYYGNDEIAYIYRNKKFHVGTYSEFSECLSEELQEKLYSLIDEYTRTPLEDRENPQRFYLQFTTMINNGAAIFLNYNTTNDSLGLSTRDQTLRYQAEFTQKEIDDIKERFGLTLSDFEQIPVEDKEKEDVDNKRKTKEFF